MKTSTLLMIGGAAAALYYLSKKNAAAGTQTPGIMSQAVARSATPTVVVNVAAPAPDSDDTSDDRYAVPGWGWSQPVYGGRAWRSGGGGGHGGHGHGHGGHH
jgi:hypothetical protein